MKESRMWRSFRPVMVEANLDPVRIENASLCGTPDVNYLHGWIELKHRKEWPKRESTLVSIPHFTQQQKNFLMKRHNLGGKAFLLLRVEDEWLLFDGLTASYAVGKMCRDDLIRVSLIHTKKKREIIQFL